MARLTDKTFAQSTAITPTTLIHIVYTGDPSQNPAGSSYKAELNQIAPTIGGYQYYSEIFVSNIELLTIGTSPVTILPTLAANQYYDFKVYIEYNYGTVAYDNCQLTLVDDTFLQFLMSTDLNCSQTNNSVIVNYGTYTYITPGTSLNLIGTTGDSTVGDGTVNVKIYYNIVDFG